MKIILVFLFLALLGGVGLVYITKQDVMLLSSKNGLERRNAIILIFENRFIKLEADYNELKSHTSSFTEYEQYQFLKLSKNIETLESIIDEMEYAQDDETFKVLRSKFSYIYNDALRSYKSLHKKIKNNK